MCSLIVFDNIWMEDGEIRPLFLCHVKHKHWFPFIKLIGHSFWSDFYEWKSDPFPFIIIFHSFDIDTSHLVARWRNCLAIYTSLQSENLSKAQTQRGFHLCTLDVLGECSLITLFQCVCIVATLLFVWAGSRAISLRPPVFPFICSTYKALL